MPMPTATPSVVTAATPATTRRFRLYCGFLCRPIVPCLVSSVARDASPRAEVAQRDGRHLWCRGRRSQCDFGHADPRTRVVSCGSPVPPKARFAARLVCQSVHPVGGLLAAIRLHGGGCAAEWRREAGRP